MKEGVTELCSRDTAGTGLTWADRQLVSRNETSRGVSRVGKVMRTPTKTAVCCWRWDREDAQGGGMESWEQGTSKHQGGGWDGEDTRKTSIVRQWEGKAEMSGTEGRRGLRGWNQGVWQVKHCQNKRTQRHTASCDGWAGVSRKPSSVLHLTLGAFAPRSAGVSAVALLLGWVQTLRVSGHSPCVSPPPRRAESSRLPETLLSFSCTRRQTSKDIRTECCGWGGGRKHGFVFFMRPHNVMYRKGSSSQQLLVKEKS